MAAAVRFACAEHGARVGRSPAEGRVRGSGTSVGRVDESATGSANPWSTFVEHAARIAKSASVARSFRKVRGTRSPSACASPLDAVASLLHRARGASRSKPSREAVRGSGRSAGRGDESATGSVNFWSRTLRACCATRWRRGLLCSVLSQPCTCGRQASIGGSSRFSGPSSSS
jgi:hypothetical protein